MSGITRDVYLLAQNREHIRDFRVKSSLIDDYKDGNLELSVEVVNGDNTTIDAVLFDGDKTVATLQGAGAGFNMSAEIPSVKAWSAEIPNLYELMISLKNEMGETLEVIRQDVGFRTSEIKNGNLLINGQYVYLKGSKPA